MGVDTAGPPAGPEDLERAIAAAVERSRPVAEGLRREVDGLSAALSAEAAALGTGDAPGDGGLLPLAAALMRGTVDELAELTAGRLDGLDTFNVVLFGRTGAGKSSLREALIQGTGGSISPFGESDWTTEVSEGQWRGCRVVDTPGIAGWGRTMDRADLEERAREALVAADVVLLCFDSQSQQAAEFAKVADWIAAYGKPVVAVLNNRNPAWRFPTRVPVGAPRRTLSRAVAEHAQNIRDELARIGLYDVPVVALHTKRAVYARATLPYQGTDGATLLKHRAEAGSTAVLLDWSNLPALEGLLGAALGRDAVGLRLGTLARQIAGAYQRADERFRTHVEEPVRTLAEQSEIGIERMLTLLGAPESAFAADAPGRAARPPRADRFQADLAALERLRGGRFDAPPVGEIERYADHLVRAALAPEREAA
ncbi:GTPase, partial [Kitasatospora putterlickiae]|uniref:GTPase n=1 Tax=Kitasatospora putterlickiae TaxID=221725 RepID=UPI0031DBC210